MLLQHLKVVLLICGVLVDYEEVRVEFGYNEAQVKLTDDLHVFKHFFAVDEDDIIYCDGTLPAFMPSFAGSTFGVKNLPDLFYEFGLGALVFSGVDFGFESAIAQVLLGPLSLLVQ